MEIKKNKYRVSSSDKNANKKAWYREQADLLDSNQIDYLFNKSGKNENERKRINYDLFNNKLNMKDFEHVCNPFGDSKLGAMPAKMENKDIVSSKIKAILGMEMKRPFLFNIIATNSEATTRKEQEEAKRVKEFVISEIMKPIKEQLEAQKMQESNGKELTPDEQAKLQQQIEEELKSQTPEEVRKYMQRDHQDPAEMMSNQLLNYLMKKEDLKVGFNRAFKHGLLTAESIMFVGILNDEPRCFPVNPLRFNSDKITDSEFIEDGEWATYEHIMSPSDVIRYFGSELKNEEIDRIYESWSPHAITSKSEDYFAEIDRINNGLDNLHGISVVHCVWKSLRKIGFLSYTDETGAIQEVVVDEHYKINKDAGDIEVEWELLPEVYETWKIKVSEPIYVRMQPIPGQFKDLDNMYNCKLPYHGVRYDSMNSSPTSLMDRLKNYQYFYNILHYRIEMLLASDKGKKVLMNIDVIPKKSGINMKQWMYYMESSPYMWFKPSEEGSGTHMDANTVAKTVDLSLISNISNYMDIAESIRQQCGRSVGITDQVEGQISSGDSVGGTRAAITQSSHLLEPYFDLHNIMKRNVLQSLLEVAKIAYSSSKKLKLSYFLDDMSKQMLNIDMELLDNSTLGLFVENSAKAEETKDLIRQLAHAALQNQKVELSDVLAVVRQDGVAEAEEILRVAETKREENMNKQQQNQIQANKESEEKAREHQREFWEHEKELIILKEEEKRKTVIIQSSLTGASFNPDQDVDKDGVNDFIEIAKYGLEADVKKANIELQRDKLEHQKVTDSKKLSQTERKLNLDEKKLRQNSKK